MQADLDKHPSDLQKACMAFIKSLGAPAAHHAVYGQTRVNRVTGAAEQVIIVHRHPLAPMEFRTKDLPDTFGGYPVVEEDWPSQDL